MNLVRLIDFLRDRLPAVVRVGCAVLALLILLDAIPAVVDKAHAHTAVEHLPAFWSVFGLLGCLLLVVLAKTVGHLGVSRREDYYDE
jgi:hypothetical protein